MENNRLSSGENKNVTTEKIEIKGTFCGKYRVFLTFLICAAILIAAFAATGIWRSTKSGKAFFESLEGSFWDHDDETAPPSSSDDSSLDHDPVDPAPSPEEPLPNGATAIVSMDLSYMDRGEDYYLNETPYSPSVTDLIESQAEIAFDTALGEPLVLIIHTHTVESYLDDNVEYIEGSISSATYSEDSHKNMIAVGRALYERLEQNGIPTVHCTVVHTGEDMSLQGSYDRSKASVEAYLKQYPSIQLVIDLHRDAVFTEAGEYVKTVLPDENDEFAQVMAVVGTDCNGTEHPNWEMNFAFALQLRKKLNLHDNGIARPVYLRRASYHQEIAPCALLLEIGTGANSLAQAKRTAERVGDALTEILTGQ